MAVLHSAESIRKHLAESKAAQEQAAKERRNLAQRAKRRGIPTDVQAQREWIKANPAGFEIR
jgi:hypothetical protein|tara:strand:- start:30 stop:215 length:186 start_codon:yes stop_codon:yes gene_type:complete